MTVRTVFLFLSVLGLVAATSSALADAKAKTAACAACHGADGNSINPIWPSLAGQGAPYIVAQLKAFKSGTRNNPSMSPMAAIIDDADMQIIAEYYASQPAKIPSIGEEPFAEAQKLYRGGDIERGIPACMACHSPTGAGNSPAQFPALRGQHAAYTAVQLKAYRDQSRTTDREGVMRDIAGKLSDEEIDGLARYVSALH